MFSSSHAIYSNLDNNSSSWCYSFHVNLPVGEIYRPFNHFDEVRKPLYIDFTRSIRYICIVYILSTLRPREHLTFNTGIPILVRHVYIETAPRLPLWSHPFCCILQPGNAHYCLLKSNSVNLEHADTKLVLTINHNILITEMEMRWSCKFVFVIV